jgi:hypothetical protein
MSQELSPSNQTNARNVIYFDGLAGGIVGLLEIALLDWLTQLHQLPKSIIIFVCAANLIYGAYSLNLARNIRRGTWPRRRWFDLLIFGNASWAVVCLVLVATYRSTISIFGLAHLLLEAAFVLWLAVIEWRLVRPFAS